MNNKKINIDDFTREMIKKSEIQQPGQNFTKNVMAKILKDPAVKVSFVTSDDKNGNLGLFMSLSVLFIGLLIFYFVTNGFNFSSISDKITSSTVLNFFVDVFSKFWNEISLSPYILIALVGVIFLVIIDKTVVRYLYSI